MSELNIKQLSNDLYEVTVYANATTSHKVTITDEIHLKLTKNKRTKSQLLERSFEFLLNREPNTSILFAFEIQVISNYFEDYEDHIHLWSQS